jgi:hypothetical protein
MKLTFAFKTFAARSFRCVTLAGPAVARPYRLVAGQAACSGAIASEAACSGAIAGQDHHAGATKGQCNG